MLRILSRILIVVTLAATLLATISLAAYLVLIQAGLDRPVIEAIGCRIGLSDRCIRAELEEKDKELKTKEGDLAKASSELAAMADELEAARRTLQEERSELEVIRKRKAELEELEARLLKLSYRTESFTLFKENTSERYTVTSGHQYKSLVEPGQFIGAFCYISAPREQGVSRDLTVAMMERDGKVNLIDPTNQALDRLGLRRDEIPRFQGRCRWPEGVR